MSVPKVSEKSNGVLVEYCGQALIPATNHKGYLHVALSRNGKQRTRPVHRLVAEAFVPNPEELPCVNHIDEDKTNNSATNLEWCTSEYNNRYGTRPLRLREMNSRPVAMVLDKCAIAWFKSTKDAEKKTGVQSSHISECCNGIRKSAGGYSWEYIGDTND